MLCARPELLCRASCWLSRSRPLENVAFRRLYGRGTRKLDVWLLQECKPRGSATLYLWSTGPYCFRPGLAAAEAPIPSLGSGSAGIADRYLLLGQCDAAVLASGRDHQPQTTARAGSPCLRRHLRRHTKSQRPIRSRMDLGNAWKQPESIAGILHRCSRHDPQRLWRESGECPAPICRT